MELYRNKIKISKLKQRVITSSNQTLPYTEKFPKKYTRFLDSIQEKKFTKFKLH